MMARQIRLKLGMGDEEASKAEMVNYRSSTMELRIQENGAFWFCKNYVAHPHRPHNTLDIHNFCNTLILHAFF